MLGAGGTGAYNARDAQSATSQIPGRTSSIREVVPADDWPAACGLQSDERRRQPHLAADSIPDRNRNGNSSSDCNHFSNRY